jgi:hypothetical protein
MVKAELKVNFEDWFIGVVTIFTLGAMYTNKFENAGCGMWNWTMGKRKIFGAEFDCLLQCYCDPLKEYVKEAFTWCFIVMVGIRIARRLRLNVGNY